MFRNRELDSGVRAPTVYICGLFCVFAYEHVCVSFHAFCVNVFFNAATVAKGMLTRQTTDKGGRPPPPEAD